MTREEMNNEVTAFMNDPETIEIIKGACEAAGTFAPEFIEAIKNQLMAAYMMELLKQDASSFDWLLAETYAKANATAA